MTTSYDILVAGGGLSGAIIAGRLHERFPDKTIAIVEKEPLLGGRLRTTDQNAGLWSYGLNAINENLYEFLDQTLKNHPDNLEISSYLIRKRVTLGALSAGKLSSGTIADSFSEQGARSIAGAAAAKDWTNIDEMMSKIEEGKRNDQPMAQAWKGTRKSPAAIATEHLTRLYGVPDIWSCNVMDLQAKIKDYSSSQWVCDWPKLCEAIIKRAVELGKITVLTETEIAEAEEKDGHWQLATTGGPLQSKVLVVSQSPWDALRWLSKEHWPNPLVNLPVKTKPVSAVILSETLDKEIEIPDVVVIPAENVQVYAEGSILSFQATVNYESTLVAPDVVKAIRRLKRARTKLLAAFDISKEFGNQHIALQPVAWSQPVTASERRVASKLSGYKWQAAKLIFCGDA